MSFKPKYNMHPFKRPIFADSLELCDEIERAYAYIEKLTQLEGNRVVMSREELIEIYPEKTDLVKENQELRQEIERLKKLNFDEFIKLQKEHIEIITSFGKVDIKVPNYLEEENQKLREALEQCKDYFERAQVLFKEEMLETCNEALGLE